jgi:hypothetical protein
VYSQTRVSGLDQRCAVRYLEHRPAYARVVDGGIQSSAVQQSNANTDARRAGSRERRTVRRPRVLRLRAGLIAALASAAIAALAAPAAFAGTRGQQVNTLIPWPIQDFQICGHNQNNDWKCAPILPTGTAPRNDQQVEQEPLFDWWWQGTINIWGWKTYNRRHPASTRELAHCRVPAFQRNNDWTTCDEARLVKPGSTTVL